MCLLQDKQSIYMSVFLGFYNFGSQSKFVSPSV